MTEYHFPLIDRHEVAEETMAFTLDTTGSDFTFEAGQNCDFTVINPPQTDAEGNMRTFSIINPPQEKNRIMFATRMRNTAFKNSLKIIPLSTKIKVIGPLGNMTLHEDAAKPAVFLAGGIGITPFHSMIADATARKLPHHITLFFSNRSKPATAFLPDLETWAQQNPNFKLVATITDVKDDTWRYETARIDVALIKKYIPDLQAPMYYLAGPQGLVQAMKTMLLENKISKDNIRLEEFTGY